MAKKEDIFGKLNIKDYNNYLEEILETKNFSSDTKNFLLSMLYKVEVSYSDYRTVKGLSKTKNEFVEEIIEIIKNDCEKIELIKPLDKNYSEISNTKEKCIVNKKEKKIVSVYNEQVLLYAIFKLSDNKYKFKNEILRVSLSDLLDNGKNINNKEVIRDFDGWAWHIEEKQIESIEYNLVFQNILMLIGSELKDEEQIKTKLSEIYNKEETKNIYILLNRIALILYLSNHNNETKKFKKIKEENLKELNEMQDNDKYIKDITSKRKKVETRLKNIDKCLVNGALLKKEYIKTNEKLSDKDKIFSMSDFEDKIQKERVELICELQKYNRKMLPEVYIQEKEQINENLNVLDIIENKKELYEYILELQKKFILGMQIEIKKAETRMQIMSIIYKIRYYKFLPYKNTQIKDIKELQEDIYETEKMIYNKACKMNIINRISVNEKVNNEVIINILNTNIVELENIELLFKAENYQMTLRIYDNENIDKILEYDTIEGLTARINKKIRLFMK